MKRMIKTVAACLVLVLCIASLAGCVGQDGGDTDGYKIAVVPKVTSSSWFQRMKNGVDEYSAEHGTDYFFGGPTDVSEQVAYLEQLLAEDWDAICVVPFDSESIAPVLEKAKNEGILIITHEAATMDPQYFDYDIEAFMAKDYGEMFGRQLVGTSVASICREYVADGTISSFSLWDSAETAKAMLSLAEQVLGAGDGFDPENCVLSVGGYENMTYKNGVFYGEAMINVDAGNLSEYDY